jgi:hypothetical protein
MANFDWEGAFLALFDRCVARYQAGDEDFQGYYSPADLEFLSSIGYKPRELFDFVEDLCDTGEPSRASALLVAAARRDFFHVVQGGRPSTSETRESDLPPRDAELGGLVWLPRILAKARAKLRGELHPDIMYSCGGDRKFLKSHDIHPADFLRAVWAAGDDETAVVGYVRRAAAAHAPPAPAS